MDAVVAASHESIAQGSKSFSAAARLFSPDMRESASMLYAWCRHCDDVIDDQHFGFAATAAAETPEARLQQLYAHTEDALSGKPCSSAPFQALQRVAAKHDIPLKYPVELIDGFAMDVAGRSYDTIEDVLDYCYHVAGVVGVMMAMVMGVREPATLVRAADLGIAFQLTNISRDVMEDAASGRCYLPGEWLEVAGVTRAGVAESGNRRAVAQVVTRLLATAEPYYASARIGLRDLPFRAGWAIAAARGIYRDIGLRVLDRGPRAWDERVSTGKGRKVYWMLAGAAIAARARTVERLSSTPVRPDLWLKPGVGA